MRLSAILVVIAASGCDTRPPMAGQGDVCTTSVARVHSTDGAWDAADVLFVVDTSDPMRESRLALTSALDGILFALLTPDDADGDGHADFAPVGDIHFGVVSTDLGTGGYAVQGCRDSIDGDDGLLLSTPADGAPGCDESYPAFLSFEEGDDPAMFSADASCFGTGAGGGGCRFEQPLGALRRALQHADDGSDLGFLRSNSILAVLLVTDGDDCTVRDELGASRIFDTRAPLGPIDLRCALDGDLHLAPVEELVRDVLAARPGDTRRLVVGATAGFPTETSCALEAATAESYACLLEAPEMQVVIDGSGEQLAPSCTLPSGGTATPPRRIAAFLEGLAQEGVPTFARSVCENDLAPAVARLGALVGGEVFGSCLWGPELEPADDGWVPCTITETLLDAAPCEDGRLDRGIDDRGNRRCHVCQAGDSVPGRRDVYGLPLPGCAAAEASGDVWRIARTDRCSRTGELHLDGRAFPAPGTWLSMSCLTNTCD